MSNEKDPQKVFLPGERLRLAPGEEPIPVYKLVGKIGSVVWNATRADGALVAIKAVGIDGEKGEGELRTFPLMQPLAHPRLVALHQIAEIKDRVLVVMELCDGGLDGVLAKYREQQQPGIPRDELLGYMTEAAEGLDFLNARHHKIGELENAGVEHCDIRPDNILLKDGHLKLADFGLATAYTEEPGKHPGIPSFASPPEMGKGELYSTSDQYSLAVVYCYLRNGEYRPGRLPEPEPKRARASPLRQPSRPVADLRRLRESPEGIAHSTDRFKTFWGYLPKALSDVEIVTASVLLRNHIPFREFRSGHKRQLRNPVRTERCFVMIHKSLSGNGLGDRPFQHRVS